MQRSFRAPIEAGGRTAPELIFRRLSEAIATGELQAGEKLPSEAELAASFGVAAMTLRRALETLRDVGLIETKRGRQGGNFVSMSAIDHLSQLTQSIAITRQDVRELTDWRRAISGEACFLAAERGTVAEFGEIGGAAREYDTASKDANAMRMADVKLHLAIAQASHSRRLHVEENQIQVELSKIMVVSRSSGAARATTVGTHDPLVKAIIERKAELARRELHLHVEETFNWIVSLAQV